MSTPTKAKTRRDLIGPALKKTGWDVNDPDQVGIEIPVDGFDPAAWKTLQAKPRRLREAGAPYDVELPTGICDYALYRPNGEAIAVVEAKRTSVGPRPLPVDTPHVGDDAKHDGGKGLAGFAEWLLRFYRKLKYDSTEKTRNFTTETQRAQRF